MTTRYHVGAKGLQGDINAYAKRFDFLEVPMPPADQPKLGATPATMKRWRKAVPPHFEFCVVLGPNVGAVKASAALDSELDAARTAINTLSARSILLRTSRDVTPSPLWRDRLSKLIDRLPSDASTIVWEPQGLWEVDDAAVFAKKIGAVLVVDPSRDPVPVGPIAYGRLRALGESRSYGASALDRVVSAIGERREAYVVIETSSALAECKRLRQAAQRSRSNTGGMSRIVRPRNRPLKVSDDEQE